MARPICFLGSFTGAPCGAATHQNHLRCQTHSLRLSCSRQKRAAMRCSQERDHPKGPPSKLDGELQEILDMSMREKPIDAKSLQESDRRVLDGITETGVKEIEEIAKEVKDDLEDLQRTFENNAPEIIEQETQAVLEAYDQRREELLGNVQNDREVISREMELIKELALSVETKQGIDKAQTFREKIYFLSCSGFTVSALYYALKGLVYADSQALSNAAIDAAIAAAFTFSFSRQRRKK